MNLTIKEAASAKKVTCAAVRSAIKLKKLKAHKLGGRWLINFDDLYEYDKRRFNRDYSMHDGKLKWDPNKDEISVRKSAALYNIPEQELYYSIKKNYLHAKKRGGAWVLNIIDLNNYRASRGKRNKHYKSGNG